MVEPEGTRRLEAILAADAAGFSRLMQQDDEGTVVTLEACRAVFRERIQAHRGRVVDMAGDSVLAVFEAATEAVRAAFEIQAALAERNQALPEPRRMRFRIGVDLGEIIHRPDGTVYGDGVNVAARLERVGEPGAVTVSGTVFNQVKNRVALGFEYIGEQAVKNIADPVRAYRVVPEVQPGSPAPSPSSVRAARRPSVLAGGAAVAVLVAIAIGWTMHTIRRDAAPPPSLPAVAVLPFDNLSGDPGQEYFADGITEEIITTLSRSLNVRVAARHNTFQYKGQKVDTRAVARDLSVRYLVVGSVRRAPDSIRITAQFIDAESGSQLWAETYQRPITPSNILDIQQEIASRVAAAIGGDTGLVVMKESSGAVGKPATELSSYECVMRASAAIRTLSVHDHRTARDCLERAIEVDPGYADAWASLANAYLDEDRFGYNTRPGALDRALEAAQRAVQLASENQVAHHNLAVIRFYRGERDAFLVEEDRAVALNPDNPTIVADAGVYFAWLGQWDKGLALMQRALALDPNPPGWYYFVPFFDHYRREEYEAALVLSQKVNMPDFFWAQALPAAAYGQLGRVEDAKPYVKRVLELKPDFEATARQMRWKQFRYQEPLLDHFMDGLRKAGFKIPPAPGATLPAPADAALPVHTGPALLG